VKCGPPHPAAVLIQCAAGAFPTGLKRRTNNSKQTAARPTAPFREIIDLADWDRSVMTNVSGESGDPSSKHYDDLITDWRWGMYHQLPYSRKAVEAVTEQRFRLLPAEVSQERQDIPYKTIPSVHASQDDVARWGPET
jgi:acyl-homoserine lactone acylase PvdQ